MTGKRNPRKPEASNEKAASFKDAAIHVLADPDRQMIIEDNIIEGWKHAVSRSPKVPDGNQAHDIIRNNTVSGSVDFFGPPERFHKHEREYLNLETLEPVKARYIPDKEFKDAECKM